MSQKKLIEAIYPLSSMQEGMLFHALHDPDSGAYFEQLNCILQGKLDVPALEQAWQKVVERHQVLRTAYIWERRKEPFQVVYRRVKPFWTEYDWRGQTAEEQQERQEDFLRADRKKGFELGTPPLMRVILIRLEDERYWLVWSHHHLLLDGWSMPLLFKEVLAFYEAFSKGQELALPSPQPYRDYIA